MRRLLIAFVLVPFLLVACGGDGGSDMPYGLDGPSWPKDAAELQATFEGLPSSLDGLQRGDAYWLTANYGGTQRDPDVKIYAVDLGGAECPGLEGSSLVRSTLEEQGALKVGEVSSADAPEGEVVWIRGHRPGGIHVFGWSVPGARWVFAVEATEASTLEAAIGAVVDATPTSS
jgi:hypothetical protein